MGNSVASFFINNKKRFSVFIKVLISVILIVYLKNYLGSHNIYESIKNIQIAPALLAVLLMALNVYLQFVKWEIISNQYLNIFTTKEILLSMFYGFTAGLITPFRVGEYFGRYIVFSKSKFVDVTIATLLDKIFNLLAILFFGLIALLIFLNYHNIIELEIALAYLIALIVIAVLIKLSISPGGWLSNFVSKRFENHKSAIELFSNIKKIFRLNKSSKNLIIILSASHYVIYLIQFTLLLSSLTHEMYIVEYVWFGSLVIFLKTIIPPISFGELGIREGAAVYFSAYFNVQAVEAFNTAILIFIINMLLPALAGLLLILKRKT